MVNGDIVCEMWPSRYNSQARVVSQARVAHYTTSDYVDRVTGVIRGRKQAWLMFTGARATASRLS